MDPDPQPFRYHLNKWTLFCGSLVTQITPFVGLVNSKSVKKKKIHILLQTRDNVSLELSQRALACLIQAGGHPGHTGSDTLQAG